MEKMKLAAIVNHWDDTHELLTHFVKSALSWADIVLIVESSESNYGEKYPLSAALIRFTDNVVYKRFYPLISRSPRENETDKRNFGLHVARELGATHFVTCDTDEFYISEEIQKAKDMFSDISLSGLVVPCETFFAKPWLTIGRDTTLVPFIHKLEKDTQHTFNRNYPYAWVDGKIRIDPTRSLNINSGVIYTEAVTMYHYSWVRRDFSLKIRNSTARDNIQRSTILHDLASAEEGYYCQFYGKTLTRAKVDFGIPDLSAQNVRQDLQPDQKAVHQPGPDGHSG